MLSLASPCVWKKAQLLEEENCWPWSCLHSCLVSSPLITQFHLERPPAYLRQHVVFISLLTFCSLRTRCVSLSGLPYCFDLSPVPDFPILPGVPRNCRLWKRHLGSCGSMLRIQCPARIPSQHSEPGLIINPWRLSPSLFFCKWEHWWYRLFQTVGVWIYDLSTLQQCSSMFIQLSSLSLLVLVVSNLCDMLNSLSSNMLHGRSFCPA
jgi:hypothetical protein